MRQTRSEHHTNGCKVFYPGEARVEAKVEAKSLKRQSIENLTLCFQCAPYLSRLHIPVVLWNRAPYITPITCKRTFGVIDNPVLEKVCV